MAFSWFAVCVVLLVGGYPSTPSFVDAIIVTLDISLPQGVAHVGENVTFNCRIAGAASNAAVRWLKSALGDEAREQVIADNDNRIGWYLNDRYEVAWIPLTDIAYYVLTVYLVTPEDAGRIRCAVPDESYSSDSDSVVLDVFKKPGELQFVGYPPGSEFTLTENEPVQIQCAARSVLPLPQFDIYVLNRTVGHRAAPNATINVRCPPAAAYRALGGPRTNTITTATKCPVHYDLDATVTISELIATHLDDGHHVTCSASLPHSNWTPSSTSLVLNVLSKPRFHCGSTKLVEIGMRNLVVECRVHYNPHPSSVYVAWRYEGSQDDTRLDLGNRLGDEYKLEETQVAGLRSGKESMIAFTIAQVRRSNIIVYHFHAANQIGSTSHRIQLVQKSSTERVAVPTTSTRRPVTINDDPNDEPIIRSSAPRTVWMTFAVHIRVFLVLFYWLIGVCSADEVAEILVYAVAYLHRS